MTHVIASNPLGQGLKIAAGGDVMTRDLEAQFHDKMLEIYEAGLKLSPPYPATGFLLMVKRRGGKDAADQLLATGDPSSGFTALYERGKESMKHCLE